jgi:hypothetical protein
MSRRSFRLSLAAAVSLALFGLCPASALITEGNPVAVESEEALQDAVRKTGIPVPFPYWRHVGQIERSTGIYLGSGYVLTAAHVGAGIFRSWDGRKYPVSEDSVRWFRNRDGSTADLCLFRIEVGADDPLAALPPVVLATLPPRRGRELFLIGAGAGKKPGAPGFVWSDDYRVRWGRNTIEEIYSVAMPTHHYASFGFATRFAPDSRCQAAPGDSGGAAFHYNVRERRWELAGVIVAVDSEFGRAKFGNQTYIADPVLFRRELAVAAGLPSAVLAVGP